jgi:hypothetical protein
MPRPLLKCRVRVFHRTCGSSVANSIGGVLYRIPPLGNATCLSGAGTCGHESNWFWVLSCAYDANITWSPNWDAC